MMSNPLYILTNYTRNNKALHKFYKLNFFLFLNKFFTCNIAPLCYNEIEKDKRPHHKEVTL